MSSYDALAASYDGLMADGSYQKRVNWLARMFQKSRIPVQTVLDMGCGTGTIACLLSLQGYRVLAVDGSEEMLTQAAKKAECLEMPPLFLCQDMTRLQLGAPVDAVISTLDSFNYLTRERDLRAAIAGAFRALKPGGQFLFDVNTPYKLQRMHEQMYMDETEESFCVWRTFFSQKRQICTYQVDLFQKQGKKDLWERSFEEHRERAWSEEQLRTFLEEAGFVRIYISGDLTNRPPKATEDRWIIRCEKPQETEKMPFSGGGKE